MQKYVITIKDDQLNIAFIKKDLGKIKLKSITSIDDVGISTYIESFAMVEMKQLKDPLDAFVKMTHNKVTNAEVILGLDNIITRTIEVPMLNAKDLKSYIDHNISDFFTVNMEEYFYDYKIIKMDKGRVKDKKISIKLVVIPRYTVIGINKLLVSAGLFLKKLSIYPDVMQQVAKGSEAIGVLDIGESKSLLTIYEEGSTFLYTAIDNQEDGYEDFTEEVEYFTDFYATRHQGEKLSQIYLVGKEAHNDELKTYMSERLGLLVDKLDIKAFKKLGSDEEIYKHPHIFLSQSKVKEIHGEAIDFSKEEALHDKVDRSFKPWQLFLILLVITLAWFLWFYQDLENELATYVFQQPATEDYISTQEEIQSLTKSRDDLLLKKSIVEEVDASLFDYQDIVRQIYAAVPNDITIQSLEMTKLETNVTFNNIPTTLDALELIIAINQLGYFEPIQITDMDLKDELETIELVLVPIAPSSKTME